MGAGWEGAAQILTPLPRPCAGCAGTVELESLATVAFTSAGKAVDKEITKYELDRFCFGTSPYPWIVDNGGRSVQP